MDGSRMWQSDIDNSRDVDDKAFTKPANHCRFHAFLSLGIVVCQPLLDSNGSFRQVETRLTDWATSLRLLISSVSTFPRHRAWSSIYQ